MPETRGSLLRFIGVGVVATAVDFGLLTFLHGLLGWDVVLSAVLAFLAAFGVNFSLNRRWTFRADGTAPAGQLVRFTTLVAANTVVTGLGIGVLTSHGVGYLVAKCLLTAVIVAVNYVVMRTWVFRPAAP